jgi:uncharacterized membrane protein
MIGGKLKTNRISVLDAKVDKNLTGLEQPRGFNRKGFGAKFYSKKKPVNLKKSVSSTDRSGVVSETIARFLGTPTFILWLTIFCVVWLCWNTLMPETARFDSADLGFTALTLILSLQASYAAPLILLAQNRQADRDSVAMERDRERASQNLADTEFLTREIESIKIALNDVATRDYIRNELREIIKEELQEKRT